MKTLEKLWLTGLAPLQRSCELSVDLPRSVVPFVAPDPLAELAAEFRQAYDKMIGGMRASEEAQIEMGLKLIKMQAHVRKKFGIKYWSRWVKINCGVSPRQVQRYIAKAKEYSKLCPELGHRRSLDLLTPSASSAED